jgi:tetratricopeptide (TPR) repeat protein
LRGHLHDQALPDIEKVLELRPDRAESYVDRALARQAMKDHAGAIEDLGRALGLNGPAGRIYLMRARIRELAGDQAGAARDRELGLKAEPSDAQSWLDRGSTRLNDRDPGGALADFDKALELNPRSLEALQNKASILSEQLGRTEEAIQILNRLVLLYPEYVPARAGRGVLLARQNRRHEAIADAEACLLRDTKPATLYQLAGIYALTSRQEPHDHFQALQLLSTALQRGYGHDLVPIDADLDPIRNLPEFKAIVAKAARK